MMPTLTLDDRGVLRVHGTIVGHTENAAGTVAGSALRLDAVGEGPMTLVFPPARTVALRHEGDDPFVLPDWPASADAPADTLTWILPLAPTDTAPALLIRGPDRAAITVAIEEDGRVAVGAAACSVTAFPNRPRRDIYGAAFVLEFPGGETLATALAAFYWDTIVPCVVERSRARGYPDPDGFVLSTLGATYGGTYPDVDHEFQIKGRLVFGNAFDWAVVRRMIELQLRVMREDPMGLWRNPCAIQPDGEREYEVRRRSLDGSAEAEMFRLTGNIEVLEAAWLYVAATHDQVWLADHIEALEGAASFITRFIDDDGLWSDVYFEDQVIKDGRVAQAAAFAAHALDLLARLEEHLARGDRAATYAGLSARLAAALARPVPRGFWDEQAGRFVDWIDRSGAAHDHLHLLANLLPVLFGYASERQRAGVQALLEATFTDFERFPSFVAAAIAAYTAREIGVGGPYDLCAAGRYWCWDAAYWRAHGAGSVLSRQLRQVAEQAARDGYLMGERYDLDHVYYVDGRAWHGAAHYYEYPCVFAWVLIHDYLGIRFTLDADLMIAPCLDTYGSVRLEFAHVALTYTYERDRFTLTNLAPRVRVFRVGLGALYPDTDAWLLETGAERAPWSPGQLTHLDPGTTCAFVPAGDEHPRGKDTEPTGRYQASVLTPSASPRVPPGLQLPG